MEMVAWRSYAITSLKLRRSWCKCWKISQCIKLLRIHHKYPTNRISFSVSVNWQKCMCCRGMSLSFQKWWSWMAYSYWRMCMKHQTLTKKNSAQLFASQWLTSWESIVHLLASCKVLWHTFQTSEKQPPSSVQYKLLCFNVQSQTADLLLIWTPRSVGVGGFTSHMQKLMFLTKGYIILSIFFQFC